MGAISEARRLGGQRGLGGAGRGQRGAAGPSRPAGGSAGLSAAGPAAAGLSGGAAGSRLPSVPVLQRRPDVDS